MLQGTISRLLASSHIGYDFGARVKASRMLCGASSHHDQKTIATWMRREITVHPWKMKI